jgi:hypothetical protein
MNKRHLFSFFSRETSRSSCHHRHGCVDFVGTRTSRNPVRKEENCFVLKILLATVVAVTFTVALPLKMLSIFCLALFSFFLHGVPWELVLILLGTVPRVRTMLRGV